ncbi:flagellar biosynthesis anti-sigma factor FlgM [Halomonas vilamensis]|uniref:Negative regulator of flagellin synthesis n=1 Tax=Vreelandella vilamensis TaxID=531309 RepID=A0ABU1H4K2_9GAMM|nr:flagellar biosynthesis anti-sigma factor FlgM [Halomonas vilamensis]MDR5898761.1 flagellar biosynthesis anti-sigma factor FlgM [Halomonas vilamensis]
MKVDNVNSLLRPSQTQPRDETQKANVGNAANAKQASADATRLSQQHVDTSQDIDLAKVDEIRDAIREGKLDIDPERIASGLLASLGNE